MDPRIVTILSGVILLLVFVLVRWTLRRGREHSRHGASGRVGGPGGG